MTEEHLKKLTVYLSPDVKTVVESLARADGRSASSYVVRLIEQHVRRRRVPLKVAVDA